MCDGSTWGPSTALALATAPVRGVAPLGRPVLVWVDDGTGATVTSTLAGGFTGGASAPVPWACHYRSLLGRHGRRRTSL